MKHTIFFMIGLLSAVAFPLCAQEWTPKDSLLLRRLLDSGEEVKLNPDANKTWLDFDTSLPSLPRMPKKKVVLTLRPYTANTKYNWDPVYQKKITVNKHTWRGNPFYELQKLTIYTNWAKRPLDAGPRESIEQIEATGLRYRVTERANNMAVGSWQRAGNSGISGDLLAPFTKEFWNVKGRKRRARTLEVLKAYGDSISARRKEPIAE